MTFGKNWRTFPPDIPGWALRLFDPHAHALTTISEMHRLIHDGMFYDVSGIVASLASGASLDICMRFDAGVVGHMTQMEYSVEDAPCDIFFYEDCVYTPATGTPVNMRNHNRVAGTGTPGDNPSGMEMVESPTVTDVGTLIHSRYVPSAGGVGGLASGSMVAGENAEWIVGNPTQATHYLWRVTNNSGVAIKLSYHFNGYALAYEDS